MKYKAATLSLVLTAIFLANPSHATLIGDDVTIERQFGGTTFYSQTATVTDGLGAEFQEASLFSFDVEESSITFNALISLGASDSQFHELRFLDLDWVDQPGVITGLALNFDDAFLNISLADFSFGADWIKADIRGWRWAANSSFFTVTIATSHDVQPVPEPGTLGLLGLGLLGLALARRKS